MFRAACCKKSKLVLERLQSAQLLEKQLYSPVADCNEDRTQILGVNRAQRKFWNSDTVYIGTANGVRSKSGCTDINEIKQSE